MIYHKEYIKLIKTILEDYGVRLCETVILVCARNRFMRNILQY